LNGYGVQKMLGFRFGLAGLDASFGHEPLVLDPSGVRDIHLRAGTLLGTSRGPRDPSKMVDTLQKHGVNALLVIGGDGSMRAAHALHEEVVRRGLSIGVVGVPKTIDNDISFVDKTFGFETAVAAARDVIDVAHAEARSVENGVGLVKLMGRHAGFIAATATVASHEVNACLVPEVPFNLLGESGLLRWVEQRLAQRGHAVVVVAEGCAVHEIPAQAVRDASGNVRFSSAEVDVGMHLKQAMEQHFAKVKIPLTLKYIDPSYTVRALRASASDAAFCDVLGRHAVHAVMAGKTDMLVGRWHRSFTHVPLTSVLSNQKRIEPSSDLWQEVVHSTGQPSFTD
jgi:6-phosphofructokinase 1